MADGAEIGADTLVWGLAQVREGAVIGRECIIGRGAYVGAGVVLGDRVKVQNLAQVYEPAVVEDGVFIGPAAVLTNDEYPRAVQPDGTLATSADWQPVGVTLRRGLLHRRPRGLRRTRRGGSVGDGGRRSRRGARRTRVRARRRARRHAGSGGSVPPDAAWSTKVRLDGDVRSPARGSWNTTVSCARLGNMTEQPPRVAAVRVHVGDEETEAVLSVLRSGRLVQGEQVAAFEEEFSSLVDGRVCVAVNSGTSALHLGLLAAGIGPGDEVVVPSFTFAATANAVAMTGATPVFADIEPATFSLDPDAVAAAVTPRTAGDHPRAPLRPPGRLGRALRGRGAARPPAPRGRRAGTRRDLRRHPRGRARRRRRPSASTPPRT